MLRRQANEFRSHFDAAMREAELAQMKEEMDKMQASVNAEVMGAEKAFKDASDVSTIPAGAIKPDVATASSFTAAATAAVFPQAAQMGQVYAKPAPEPATRAATRSRVTAARAPAGRRARRRA